MKGKGVCDNKVIFDSVGKITRAEFVQVLYNMEKTPEVVYKEIFTDVKNNKWYTNAITWAYDNDIVRGKGDVFDVNGKITREEAVTILRKYAVFKGYSDAASGDVSVFEDHTLISTWAVDNMRWAVGNKIMNGKGSIIDPLGNASRAECAAILKNFNTAFSR